MGKVVNLRQARKAAAREAARQKGDENAARHGRSKAQKWLEETEAASQINRLEQHKRDD